MSSPNPPAKVRLLYIPILIHTTMICKNVCISSNISCLSIQYFLGSPPFTPPKTLEAVFFSKTQPTSPFSSTTATLNGTGVQVLLRAVRDLALSPIHRAWAEDLVANAFQEAPRPCRRKRPFKSMRSWWRTCNPCPGFFLKIYDEIDFWIYIYDIYIYIKHEVFSHSLGCFIYDEIDFEYFYKTWRLFS